MNFLYWQWLKQAEKCGYEEGFYAAPCDALAQLEKLGYLERNPTTSGAHTQWRITEEGAERAKRSRDSGLKVVT